MNMKDSLSVVSWFKIIFHKRGTLMMKTFIIIAFIEKKRRREKNKTYKIFYLMLLTRKPIITFI